MLDTSTDPYRTDPPTERLRGVRDSPADPLSAAPTPGFHGDETDSGSQGSHNEPTSRPKDCGVGRHGSQGCDNRIAQTNPCVSSNAPIAEARQPFAATNGRTASLGGSLEAGAYRVSRHGVPNLATQCTDPRETGRSRSQLLRPQPKRVAPIDRTGCPGKPGAHAPKRIGTATAYRHYGCTCPDARESCRLYYKRGREGRRAPGFIDATGTARRLQALACLGYSPPTIGGGYFAGSQLRAIRAGRTATVTVPLRNHVASFYSKCSELPLPYTRVTGQARSLAKLHGWAPPAAWDNIDDALELPQHQAKDTGGVSEVEKYSELAELLAGHSKLNASWLPTESLLDKERRLRLNSEAIRILEGRGLEASEIADRLKLSDRTVHRYRNLSTVGPPGDNSTKAETTPSAISDERHHAA